MTETGIDDDRAEELVATAKSLRGSFSTIEDMTKGFIRTAITKGLFTPGQRLPQDSLAELLGVSRMPVRAALRQLEAENLVTFHPHRGATVRELSPEEIGEIYQLRIALESQVLDIVVPRLSDEHLKELDRLRNRQVDRDDVLLEVETRREFYTLLCEIAERPWTQQLLLFLHTALGPYRLLHRHSRGERRHLELVDHLHRRDLEGAKAWLHKHLSERSEELQRLVQQRAGGDEAAS